MEAELPSYKLYFMESFNQNLEEEKIFSAMEKEREAKVSEQEREKFGGDYSINPENIKRFTDVVLEKIIEKLPENINAVYLGGGGRAFSREC